MDAGRSPARSLNRDAFNIQVAHHGFNTGSLFTDTVSQGTRQFSKDQLAVGEARIPILEKFLPVENPGNPR